MSTPRQYCNDKNGDCFARDKHGKCAILKECPHNCGFKKPTATKTNGRDYPFNPLYVGMNDLGGREMTGKAWREAHGNTV